MSGEIPNGILEAISGLINDGITERSYGKKNIVAVL